MPQQRIPIQTFGSLRQHFAIEAGGEAYVNSTQDCTRIAEENKALSSEHRGTTKNGTAIAARVPSIYRYVKWPAEFQLRHGVHPDRPPRDTRPERRMEIQAAWAEFYRGKLNHPDFRAFRTDGGKRL